MATLEDAFNGKRRPREVLTSHVPPPHRFLCRSFTRARLSLLIVSAVLATSCNISDDVIVDGGVATPDLECIRIEPGDTWFGITGEFGLNPAAHWEAVSEANPQAGNENTLFAGADVCLTAEQRESILAVAAPTIGSTDSTSTTSTTAEGTSSTADTTSSTVEMTPSTGRPVPSSTETTSTTSRPRSTTEKPRPDADLYVEPTLRRIRLHPGCDINVNIRNDGPDDVENVVVIATIQAGGIFGPEDFELAGPSLLRGDLGRPLQYQGHIGLAIFDQGLTFSIRVRVEGDRFEAVTAESSSTCPARG